MSEFTFNINEIGDECKELSWPIQAAWVESELAGSDLRPDRAAGPGLFELRVQRTGSELLLQGHAAAHLLLPCVRCLEDAPFAVSVDLVGLVKTEGSVGGSPDEIDDAELGRDVLEGDVVRLDGWLREHIVLECPMRHVCGDDCNGLEVPAHIRPPDDFGEEREGVDPRLAPLLELKDKVLPNKE
ncbi:MAG: YceD family protein [Myxococcales bacterium]|nr:YceD family protein [Myxococcales bacterium]MDD9971244.1 YceD family protein [Myxococcales bacterium]